MLINRHITEEQQQYLEALQVAQKSAAEKGLYSPENEHDSCGVGMVANILGKKSHTIIEQGLEVLNNLEHRGAECCDPDTGDGSGIMFQLPDAFFRKVAPSLGFELPPVGQYGVGMVFLPPQDEPCADCQTIIKETVEAEGQKFLGWRDVPVNPDSIGWLARSRLPVIRQFFVGCGDDTTDSAALERKLFVIRRVIERTAFERNLGDGENFYLCSLSVNRIVYKGLIKSSQIPSFYLDIHDEDVTSAFAMCTHVSAPIPLGPGRWRIPTG